MSLSKNIIDELKNQGSIPNVYQEHLIKVFDNIQLNIGLIDEIVNFFKKRSLGIYIWGEVGRGKTLLTNAFLKNLPKKIPGVCRRGLEVPQREEKRKSNLVPTALRIPRKPLRPPLYVARGCCCPYRST